MGPELENSQLHPSDHRSDSEILADLQTYKPVDGASERNIWAFGTKGLQPVSHGARGISSDGFAGIVPNGLLGPLT
jgi:hypothetical protein